MSNIVHIVEVLAQGTKKPAGSSVEAKILHCRKAAGGYLVKVEARANRVVRAMPLVKSRVQALGLTTANIVSYQCFKESVSGARTEIQPPIDGFEEKQWSMPDIAGLSNQEVLQVMRDIFGIKAERPRSMMDDLLCV